MPLGVHQSALERQRLLMPQLFDGGRNQVGQSDENSRRRGSVSIQAAPIAKAATPVEAPAAIAAPASPPPVTIPFDRLHKFATSQYGGYVIVGPVHDGVDGDPFPNSGYPLEKTTAATVAIGIAKAVLMLPKVKQGRVAVIVLSSVWNEGNISISVAGIDMFGIGRPRINGHVTVSPDADASFYDLDFFSGGMVQAIQYLPATIVPNAPFVANPPGLIGCRVYGGDRAAWFQRRVYCRDTEFYQTLPPNQAQEHGAVRMETLGPFDLGWSKFFNCQFYSYIDASHISTWGARPAGFAIEARSLAAGPLYIGKIHDEDAYAMPSSGMLLDHCEIYGALLVEQWNVKHLHCYCLAPLGGVDFVGGVYARMRGQPLFNPDYYANAVAIATWEHSDVHARTLADATPWFGFKTGDPHPGTAYVAFRKSQILPDWTTPVSLPFTSSGGQGEADIVSSDASIPGGGGWSTASWVVATFGACATNATGLRDLYTM